ASPTMSWPWAARLRKRSTYHVECAGSLATISSHWLGTRSPTAGSSLDPPTGPATVAPVTGYADAATGAGTRLHRKSTWTPRYLARSTAFPVVRVLLHRDAATAGDVADGVGLDHTERLAGAVGVRVQRDGPDGADANGGIQRRVEDVAGVEAAHRVRVRRTVQGQGAACGVRGARGQQGDGARGGQRTDDPSSTKHSCLQFLSMSTPDVDHVTPRLCHATGCAGTPRSLASLRTPI